MQEYNQNLTLNSMNSSNNLLNPISVNNNGYYQQHSVSTNDYQSSPIPTSPCGNISIPQSSISPNTIHERGYPSSPSTQNGFNSNFSFNYNANQFINASNPQSIKVPCNAKCIESVYVHLHIVDFYIPQIISHGGILREFYMDQM